MHIGERGPDLDCGAGKLLITRANNIQYTAVDLKPAVVLNETQFLNWVLREACARGESLGPEQP